MGVFLSLVGFQPTAVAEALASWLQARPATVSHVVLLPTRATRAVADRLKTWTEQVYSLPCDIQEVSGSLLPENELLPPAQLVCQWINAHEELARELIFNAKPGMNFHVVSVCQVLPEHTVFLHPDDEQMYACSFHGDEDGWEAFALVDLGLDAFLALYDLRARELQKSLPRLLGGYLRELNIIHLPAGISQNLAIQQIPFDLVYAAHGMLFGLITIEGKDRIEEKDRQKAYDVRRMSNDLNGLRPRLTVLANNPTIIEQLREDNVQVIDGRGRHGRQDLRRWLDGKVPPSGHQEFPSASGEALPVPEALGTTHAGGGGKTAVALAVSLGNDPSATLASLYTHKPQQAWILYDQHTPAVVKMAERLVDVSDRLPVGECVLIPTDRLGRGSLRVLAKCISQSPQLPLRVDVSPGTKTQGVMLARMPGATIWSLKPHEGKASCISNPRVPELPLSAPDIVCQAQMRGGALWSPGLPIPREGFPLPLYRVLLQFFRVWLAEQSPLKRMFSLEKLDKLPLPLQCSVGDLSLVNKQALRYRVRLNGIAKEAAVKERGGDWFESLTAVAFHDAGANEVRQSIVGDWPENTGPGPSQGSTGVRPRYEIDVVAQFQHRFLVVECEAGKQSNLRKIAHEAEAKARHCAAGQCLPVVVRPYVELRVIADSIRKSSGAIVLDIAAIADPKGLAEKIEESFRARSTHFES